MTPVKNLEIELESIRDLWSPKVIAQVNDQYVKLAKLKGEFTWHKHDSEDELFLLVKGELTIQYEGGRSVSLKQGDLHVVPKNTLHNPVAAEECWIVLIETVSTKHTGNVVSPVTKTIEQQLA